MNRSDFQEIHLNQFRAIMESQCGKDMLETLRTERMPLLPIKEDHLLIENSGAVRGYEQCLKNLAALAVPIIPKKPDPKANYGATKKPLPSYLDEQKKEVES